MRTPPKPPSLIAVFALGAVLVGCGEREKPAPTAPSEATAPAATRGTGTTLPHRPVPSGPSLSMSGGVPGQSMDIRPLAGQGEAAIRMQLGTPQSCEDVPQGRRCQYPNGRSDVVFIDGVADHIVIADLGGAAFEPATIARIGLAGEEPLEVGPDAIRWQNVGGLRSVVLERGPDGRAGRFVIKAMSP